MKKRFNGITYDMSQNVIIKENKRIGSLKHYSIVLISAHLFKSPEVIDSICKWIKDYKYNIIRDATSCDYIDWQSIESTIVLKLLGNDYIKFNELNKTLPYMEKIIHLVGMQILDFITKDAICIFIEARLFLSNLVFTSEGSINLRKTVLRILNKEPLKPLLKFQLVCFYFSNFEIIYYCFRNLPEYERKCLEEQGEMGLNYYKYFWMSQIRYFEVVWLQQWTTNPDILIFGNINSFKKQDSKLLVNIFYLAVTNNNETSVQYLWDRYINLMPDRKYILVESLKKIILFTTHVNITMFLLLQENSNELDALFKNMTIPFSLICNLIENVRWRDYFLEIFKKLKIYFDEQSCSKIFVELTNSYFTSYPTGISLDSLASYFHCLSSKAKEYVVIKTTLGIGYPFERVLTEAIHKKRKKLVGLLLKPLSRRILERFFISKSGMTVVTEAIKSQRHKFVDKVLQTYFESDDLMNIKKKTFLKMGVVLCKHFIKNCRFEKLRLFVNSWTDSLSSKEITNIKLQILYMLNGYLIKDILFSGNSEHGDPFSRANAALFWCLKSKKFVNLFKKKINLSIIGPLIQSKEHIQCYDKVRDIVLNSKYDFLAKLLTWKKTSILEKRDLRRKLLYDDYFLTRIFLMKDILGFLNSFLLFLIAHLDLVCNLEVKNFKEIVFLRVVKMENPIIIKELFTWCEPSRTEFEKYKHFIRSAILSKDASLLQWWDSCINQI
ncbi:UNVERIFIED_CONTAM: hypothetical protein RMT77_011331 [Armadillidium vulgare]